MRLGDWLIVAVVVAAMLGMPAAAIVMLGQERAACQAKACERGQPVYYNGLCICAEVPR